MDDGMQFVKTEKVVRTQPMYVVAATSKRGELVFPFGANADRELVVGWAAEEAAKSNVWLGNTNYHVRVWLPEHRFQDESITLEAYEAMQAPTSEAAESVRAVAEEVAEIIEEAPRIMAEEAHQMIAEAKAEDADAYVAPKTVYLTYNKQANRYEATVNAKLYCVSADAFSRRLDRECDPTDDIERVANWLLKFSNWQFSGVASGAYILG